MPGFSIKVVFISGQIQILGITPSDLKLQPFTGRLKVHVRAWKEIRDTKELSFTFLLGGPRRHFLRKLEHGRERTCGGLAELFEKVKRTDHCGLRACTCTRRERADPIIWP